jgi:DNA (cytosine-5)-methyltransferase 1
MARSGLLPTPTVCGNYNRKGASANSGDGLATAVGGKLSPRFVEWMMGLPDDWTALDD